MVMAYGLNDAEASALVEYYHGLMVCILLANVTNQTSPTQCDQSDSSYTIRYCNPVNSF